MYHPVVATPVWSPQRKLLGNLVPALGWLPLVAGGLIVISLTNDLLGLGLALVVAGNVVGWLLLNQFGLYQNAAMRRELERMLERRGESLTGKSYFVGFATPRYTGLVDAHEDVGFLVVQPEQLRFVSETRTVPILRLEVRRIRFRANVHSVLGLGRWICVEGVSGGKEFRLLVEPRQHRTMLANMMASRTMLRELQTWLEAKPAAKTA